MEHTPGPWRLGNTCGTIVSDGEIGTHRDREGVDYYGGNLVCESVASIANAKLIAAAPELLTVCKAILKVDIPLRYGLLDQLKAAIAKAEDL